MHHIHRQGRKHLLIPGIGGSWQSWSTIIERLSAHRTVIAVQPPGHGIMPAEAEHLAQFLIILSY